MTSFPPRYRIGSVILAAGFAFVLYWSTLAPGLSWQHHGADGGDLLVAAVTNGVPHPPGYPLYMLLLQGWLWLFMGLLPGLELAWAGNLFSAFCAALSVALTILAAAMLLRGTAQRWPAALIGGGLWAVCPLLWSQALITEVYALHMFLVTLTATCLFVRPTRWWLLGLCMGLGIANHATFALLVPAMLYYRFATKGNSARGSAQPTVALWKLLTICGIAALVGGLFYLRIPLVAPLASPVNWGYAEDWPGFWWLVSGSAYRGYLFSASSDVTLARVAAWAYTLTAQFTPLGLGVALLGLSDWDRRTPVLRNFSLLWLVPVSLYAIVYYTVDSLVYLLPVVWISVLWLAQGIAVGVAWLCERWPTRRKLFTNAIYPLGGIVLLVLILLRLPVLSLHRDHEATDFLHEVAQTIDPSSILISNADAETFALWYGLWGSGQLAETAPDLVLVNDALYQFDWYRRLVRELYPHVPAVDASVSALLTANQGTRSIYFSEPPAYLAPNQLEAVGPLWRYNE